MSTQTTISQYFSNRKRQAIDEIKSVNQATIVLTEDGNSTDVSLKRSGDGERLILKRKISWDSDGEAPKKKVITPLHHHPKRTPKFTTLRTSIKKNRVNSAERSSIRKTLFTGSERKGSTPVRCDLNKEFKSLEDPQPLEWSPVPLPGETISELDGTSPTCQTVTTELPPTAIEAQPSQVARVTNESAVSTGEKIKLSGNSNNVPIVTVSKDIDTPGPSSAPSLKSSNSLRTELGLGELKAKLKGSSRLDKIRNALNKLNKGYDKLSSIQAKGPSLKKFTTIELEVPCSPVKASFKMDIPSVSSSPSKLREALFKSPAKSPAGPRMQYVSPRKLLEEMRPGGSGGGPTTPVKVPFYERYSSFAAQAGKPSLPLPYSYRLLGEVFRSIEIVVSMCYNRRETVHLSKLKRSTQELTKKNLSEHRLGQILRVFPNAYRLSYERVKVQGKPNRFELTVLPLISSDGGENCADQMAPSIILERQRYFYKELLDLTKTYHEKYLLSLDPPLVVDKEKLTRWHPCFDLDLCPDIEPVEIPQPPPIETFCNAKELLGKAKEMFIVNPRMEKALEKLSHTDSQRNGDNKPSAASAIPGLANALKGLPKSLLEKVRARQAAKAVDMLTRDPEKTKHDIQVSRLPEMARILRNLYVVERKNVIEKSHLLDKLASSFREKLSPNEMDHHLTLLINKTDRWLKIIKYGHVSYISMDKSMEMSNIFDSINQSTLATKVQQETQ